MRRLARWGVALALLPLAACNPNASTPMQSTVPLPQTMPMVSARDQSFAEQAAASDLFEIQSARLALQRSRSPAVRAFANRMIADHGKSSEQLAALAAAKGITLPTGPDPEQQRMLAAMQNTRRIFDSEYARQQAFAHQATATAYETEINSGYDAELRGFAQQTLPIVQDHLAMAQQMREGGGRRMRAEGRRPSPAAPISGMLAATAGGSVVKVGVIGLGSMGMGAALNLVRAGHDVAGCEVRPEAWPELEQAGGQCVASPEALPEGLEALIVFVVNAAQAEQVLQAALGRLAPDAVVLGCTTVAPEAARTLGRTAAESGRLYLDAPVSGGAVGARAGQMTVMASGSAAAFRRAAPVLEAIAGKVWSLGDAPGVGSTVKMVNQLLAGVHIAAAGEAMALGIRAGADPRALFEVISSSAGSSWMWQNRVPHILDGDDTPKSAVNIFVKDLGIVLDQARALTFPLPMASAAHQLFLAAAAAGHGGRDDAFVIRVWEALAGITLPGGALPRTPPEDSRPLDT